MTLDPALVLVVHAAATWGLTGLIWFVQLVHYPSYRDVGPANFVAFQTRSPARTGWVVAPLMAAETASAAWLLWQPPAGLAVAGLWMGALLVAVNWVSTVLVQVPLHVRLTIARDAAGIERLIRTNWVRTIAWSVRAVLAAVWLLAAAQR